MATTYVVLRELTVGLNDPATLDVINNIEANNAEQACRRVAERMVDGAELAEGVTLIAVPSRNWTSGRHTLKAETTRRIRSA